jgi:poly-gamma-glutamate capsule biosynthesis protein CapA/YwtB (metallophosphatase superfamily)
MKINFLGDIGIFSKFEQLNIDPFKEIQLPQADLTIGNFEFTIPKGKNKFFYDVQDQYSCSYDYFTKLKVNRFHGFGLANNHCLDYGLQGIIDTVDHLKKSEIQVFGFSQNQDYNIGRFEVNEIKLGIIACVKKGRWSKEKYGYGPDTFDVNKIANLIKENRKDFDHIVVYPHWGTELIDIPNPEDIKSAKIFIDAGASAVIGHHPHVSQGIEQYKNGLIAYSLGSFIYIHEDELGYSKRNRNRDISICLNVEFSKTKILMYKGHYFRYNHNKKIPEIILDDSLDDYIRFVNNNIYSHKLYNQEIREILIRRELRSFWKRFQSYPVRTLLNYYRHLISKIKRKIF